MSKTLKGHRIQRWKEPLCDSKLSPCWRKRDLKSYIRRTAVITADCMVSEMAEHNAKVEYGIDGWSPEFSCWFSSCRVRPEIHSMKKHQILKSTRTLNAKLTVETTERQIRKISVMM
ncbi:hypothetical protein JOE25_000792 [Serratia sp. PL17]|nr:hypothetical protein [Serratia sp. PL17]